MLILCVAVQLVETSIIILQRKAASPSPPEITEVRVSPCCRVARVPSRIWSLWEDPTKSSPSPGPQEDFVEYSEVGFSAFQLSNHFLDCMFCTNPSNSVKKYFFVMLHVHVHYCCITSALHHSLPTVVYKPGHTGWTSSEYHCVPVISTTFIMHEDRVLLGRVLEVRVFGGRVFQAQGCFRGECLRAGCMKAGVQVDTWGQSRVHEGRES